MRSRAIRGKTVGHIYACYVWSPVKRGNWSPGKIQLKLSLREGTKEKVLWVKQIGICSSQSAQRPYSIIGHTLSRIYSSDENSFFTGDQIRHLYFCKMIGARGETLWGIEH